jgi:hypothetical protein
MNTELERLTKRIISEARNWTLWDWKIFRAKNDYWFKRDESVQQKNELGFKRWKLTKMKEYNLK